MSESGIVPATLAQRLAVMTQIHLPGTVGRILKQNRDIEAIAPYFKRDRDSFASTAFLRPWISMSRASQPMSPRGQFGVGCFTRRRPFESTSPSRIA
jgi:hypothetical protein